MRRLAAGLPLALALTLTLCVSQCAGVNYTVFTAAQAPFMMRTGSNKDVLAGFEYDLWEHIAADIALTDSNFSYTYEFVGVGNVIDRVVQNETGIGLAALSITLARERRVDFSHRYFDSGLDILVMAEEAKPNLFQFFEPFTLEVWFMTVVLLVVSGHIIWFLERDYQPKLFPRSYFKGVNEGIWYCWGVLTSTSQRNLRGFPARMYSVGWSTLGILLIAAYTANFATMLTLSRADVGIRTLDDLGGRTIATVQGSTGEAYLEANVGSVTPELYKDITSAIEDLIDRKIDAIIYDAPVLLYYMAALDTAGEMRLVGTLLTEDEYGFALNKNSALKEAVSSALLRADDTGILDNIYDKWFNRADPSGLQYLQSTPALSFTTAAGLYILLAVFLVAAIVACIWVRFAKFF